MIIRVKNKDTLIAGEFRFKCSIGRSGTRLHKLEGDGSTPKGIYKFGKVYWRNDREKKPFTGLSTVKIKKKMVWCNDIKSKYYNKTFRLLLINYHNLFYGYLDSSIK